MKTVFTISLLILGVFLSKAQDTLLIYPQKIVIDKAHNRYLVSNFGSLGDLVKIDSLGIQRYFVENAHMNDGMQIVEDTVYGSGDGSDGSVLGYDLNSGELVMDINIAGVNHLSSFVVDSMGILYTSERFGNRIFKINPKTQEYWVWVEGEGNELHWPNGLLYEPEYNRMLVCQDVSNPKINAINLTDSTIYTITSTNLAGSDGIAKDMEGNYYITGYELPGIYKFSPDFSGDPELFFEGDKIIYPTYNEDHNSLLFTYYDDKDWGEIFLDSTLISLPEIAKSATIEKIYPNPFSDNTTINFNLNNRSNTKLEVFDTLGKRINILVDETKQPGTYTVSWNGKNNSGKQVSNGTYYFKLTVKRNTATRSVILQR
ncbi:FlgD immunoglobulin-like domain containing protein [Lentimicrobium sp. S6]|uniref:FlgD immunoglobulin-like domain containing protein n=1 Tax=Lentimicrobium sp. S6 TaxID=2735872 RepID=UPI0015542A1E|nr:FlgD immunoglobulin-like domain containing protein [Lentimicrobium sp. S6]NPD47292.1 T9SS type A sorting domain-containing protein [Lentimicrobium sp. S6]